MSAYQLAGVLRSRRELGEDGMQRSLSTGKGLPGVRVSHHRFAAAGRNDVSSVFMELLSHDRT